MASSPLELVVTAARKEGFQDGMNGEDGCVDGPVIAC